MFKKIISSPFVFFPLLTCVVFWPISLNLFTFKNDALTYYYPIRTLISDALNNKELPLWTPFINMGYPLHADMQSGAWNPIIWLFSFCTHYTLYAFHVEMLVYFSFAGIGFYFLGKEFRFNKHTAVIVGLAYEYSGFMLDSVQFFVCISAACYLPYILLFFKRLIENKKIKDAVLTSLFLFLLFTGSYPALFIITFYLLLAYLFFHFFSTPDKWYFIKTITTPLFISIFSFSLLSLPAIISFIQHLQFIDRGNNQSLSFAQQNSLLPVSIISLIAPFSTSAIENWLDTDPLMRSVYMGLVPLLFIIYGLLNPTIWQQKKIRFFIFSGIILFALALGSHFFLHKWAYYFLPMINTFRHPAIFRLFGVFCMLIVTGYAIDFWLKNNIPTKNKLLKRILLVLISSLVLFTMSFCFLFRNEITILSFKKNNFTLGTFYSQLNFIDRFLLQIPFVLIILLLILIILNYNLRLKYLVILCIIDIFIASQFNIPATVIGTRNTSLVTTILNRNKEPFPTPKLTSINENSQNSLNTISGSSLPFTKIIGRNSYYITPGNLKSQEAFYSSTIQKIVFDNPVLYFANNSTVKDVANGFFDSDLQKANKYVGPENSAGSSINIIKLTANTLLCNVQNKEASQLVYLQNNYPGWQVFIDDKPSVIQQVNISFMAVNLTPGEHTILFWYKPNYIKSAWCLSLLTLIFLLLFLIGRFWFNFFNKSQQ